MKRTREAKRTRKSPRRPFWPTPSSLRTSRSVALAELADVDEKNARSKEDKEITEETLAADTKFLADDEERTKTRQMEIQAVSKALEFLSSDEAHDLMTRTFNPALLQFTNSRRAAAEKVLRKYAA